MEIEGEIQNIRKDRKALQIDNEWYNSHFKLIPNDIQKGDFVKILFVIKNDFKNIKSVQVFKKAEIKSNKEINPQTFNSILMIARDLYIQRKDITIEEATDLAVRSYKRLINSV